MNRSHRMDKVNALIHTLLGQVISREYPTNDLVTILAVTTTRDLGECRIIVTATTNAQEHVAALNALAPTLRRLIKPKLDMKIIPNLTFEADRATDQINRVTGILDHLYE